ncbi:ABC transporter permease [Dyella jejuensis]|uniref:ABC transporter permease n=1 Tax=Dyella jejuensis TaxID=1432009 RepID=A0ABW8JLJ1_9GAMM
MFGYYLDLALRSLKRNAGLTVLMVLSIGVGVALAMTTWTLVHMMGRDPIPNKSARLFMPTIDAWGPSAMLRNNEPPSLMEYGTAVALMRDHRARFQSPTYWINPTIIPTEVGKHPFVASGFAVSSELFSMVDAPFKYGSGWSDADDESRAQVAVIGENVNDEVFGGGNSVGKSLTIEGRSYRVIGVLSRWNPQPVYFNVPAFGGFMVQPIGVMLPFNTAIQAAVPRDGERPCLHSPEQGFDGLLRSSCLWISYIVELDSAQAVQDYKQYLQGFARQNFAWPPNVRLRDLMSWLDYRQVVPPGVRILRTVGIGLLIVCLVNTIGLMLAKFLRRSGEIGVRRALGAPRSAIYAQFLTEGALIGVIGGLLGLSLTWLGMLWLRLRFPENWSVLTQIDLGMLSLTLVIGMFATLLAALYPAFRAARVQPSWQLKAN